MYFNNLNGKKLPFTLQIRPKLDQNKTRIRQKFLQLEKYFSPVSKKYFSS